MEQSVLSKLILAKNFFRRGDDNLSGDDVLGRMVAIHHYHISIEITLRNIISHYEVPSYNTNIGFVDVITLIRKSDRFKSEGLKLPYESAIKNINSRRNDIQHSFAEPSHNLAAQTGIETYKFLTECYKQLFNYEFDSVNELILVENELIRKFLQLASDQHSAGHYDKSCVSSVAAFQFAREYNDIDDYDRFKPRNFDFDNILGGNDDGLDRLAPHFKRMNEQITQNTDRINLLLSGMDMKAYSNYIKTAPYVSIMMDGGIHRGANRVDPTSDVSAQVLDFVTNTILVYQNSGKTIDLSSFETGANRYLESEDPLDYHQ